MLCPILGKILFIAHDSSTITTTIAFEGGSTQVSVCDKLRDGIDTEEKK